MNRLLARLRALFHRGRLERELDEELRYHLERDTERRVARGVPPEQARLDARLGFGNLGQTREAAREAWLWSWLETLGQDLHYAARGLRRSPGFTLAAAVSLALGIGASTVAFSALDALFFRRLPVPSPGRLVYAREFIPPERNNIDLSYPTYLRMRDAVPGFAAVAAVTVFDRSNITLSGSGGGLDAGAARVALVSGNYFTTLGVSAARGRALLAEDDPAMGERAVVVISDAYWSRRLRRAPDVVGRTLTLNSTAYTIVGVMARDFTGDWVGRPMDIWVPLAMHHHVLVELPGPLIRPADQWLHIIGRLKPGVTAAQAEAEAQAAYVQLRREESSPGLTEAVARQIAQQRLHLLPASHGFSLQRDALRQPIGIFSAVVVLVLLIACANLASLLLARAMGRGREMAVRLAIGAARSRLSRQLLTESLLLGLLGGGLGALFSLWGTRALAVTMAAGPVQMFFARSAWISFDVRLNGAALALSLLLSLLTGVLFGLAPALRGPRVALAPTLTGRRQIAGGAGESHGARFGLGRSLVVLQVALSLLVLSAAGLLLRTLRNLRSEDLGFERDRVLLIWTQPSGTGADTLRLRELWHRVQERLEQIPGVVSAGASNQGLLTGSVPVLNAPGTPMQVEGEPARPTGLPMFRSFVTPRFFATMGIPLLAGRDFTEQDTDLAPPVLVINQSMARFYFDQRNPIGRRVHFGAQDTVGAEVIGVVGDFISGTPRAAAQKQLLWYISYKSRQSARRIQSMMAVVRTRGSPRALIPEIRRELQAVDPTLPVLKLDTVAEQLDDVLAQDRLIAGVALFFGILAALLAAVGLYGVVAYRTARRSGEIGIRMALGATRRGVVAMVLRESVMVVLLGVGLGVPAALAALRLIVGRLYGVGAADPTTLAVASALLIVIASLASLFPARRAARVDPMSSLRLE